MKLTDLNVSEKALGAKYAEQYLFEVLETGSVLCQDTHVSLRLEVGEEFDTIVEYQDFNGTPYSKASYKIEGAKVQFGLAAHSMVCYDGGAVQIVKKVNTLKSALTALAFSKNPTEFTLKAVAKSYDTNTNYKQVDELQKAFFETMPDHAKTCFRHFDDNSTSSITNGIQSYPVVFHKIEYIQKVISII